MHLATVSQSIEDLIINDWVAHTQVQMFDTWVQKDMKMIHF